MIRSIRVDASGLDALLPRLRAIRHDLHRHPELGFAEVTDLGALPTGPTFAPGEGRILRLR